MRWPSPKRRMGPPSRSKLPLKNALEARRRRDAGGAGNDEEEDRYREFTRARVVSGRTRAAIEHHSKRLNELQKLVSAKEKGKRKVVPKPCTPKACPPSSSKSNISRSQKRRRSPSMEEDEYVEDEEEDDEE